MGELKFRWVGRNRKFDEIQINSELTIRKILDGNFFSFFNDSNRGKNGNCEFLSEDLFTTLKDKNGVEIYEGDILDAGDRIVKVIWHPHAGQWDTLFIKYVGKKTSEGLTNLEWKYRATLIGNIHENPELLK